jgi:hypothetical protein
MAPDAQALTLAPGAWSPAVGQILAPALPYANVAELRHQIDHLGAVLYLVHHDGAVIGAFVLRVDTLSDRFEGVIVAGAASLAGVNVMASVLPAIESLFINCQTVRFHTAEPAVARKMARLGYVAREIVCTKTITP